MSSQSNPSAEGVIENEPFAENVVSGSNYLFFLIPILALMNEPYKKNNEIRFHAFQSLLLQGGYAVVVVAGVFINIFLAIVSSVIFNSMGLYGVASAISLMFSATMTLLGLLVFGAWAYVTVNAFMGKRVALPYLGKYASKFANQ